MSTLESEEEELDEHPLARAVREAEELAALRDRELRADCDVCGARVGKFSLNDDLCRQCFGIANESEAAQ